MRISDFIAGRLRQFLRIEPAQERHIVIRESYSFEACCAKNRIWYAGKPNQLSEFYRQMDDKTTFWGAPMTAGMEIRKINTGMFGLVIDMVTQIVINDFNGIEFSGAGFENAQTRWAEIAKDNDFDELLKQAVRDCAIVGDGAFKVSFDAGITDNPIIEFFPAERVEFIRRRGRLVEIKFKTEYIHRHKLYHLVESYGFGYIKYTLVGENGDELPLDAIPETAQYNGQDVTFDDKTMWAVPMIYEHSALFHGRGKGLMEDKDLDADALDEAFSQWMDALRAGRSKTYIPDKMIPRNPVTLTPMKPNAFDNRFIATEADMSEHGDNQIVVTAPEIRADAYLTTYTTALGEFLQGIVSPSTLGIDTKKLDNAEAQREKEKTTLYTRQNFVEMVQTVVPKLVRCVLNAQAELLNEQLLADSVEVKAKFGEYANPSFESQIETVSKAKTSGIMSIEQCVEELYGDSKTDEWKSEEVERIKNEQGIVEMPQPYEADDIGV